MIEKKLKDFLDSREVKYVTVPHSPAFTARETARAAHVRGKDFAKTVMVRIDGRLAMAVLPASEQLDLAQLSKAAGVNHVNLAHESEFDQCFPGCEPGAMPPFGNLYGMEVFVAKSLAADDTIAFNAGSHAELVMMAYKDFERLVRPIVATFAAAPQPAGNTERV